MLTADQARFLPDIYSAAVSDAEWPVALSAVAHAAGARGATLFAQDLRGEPFSIERFSDLYDARGARFYNEHLLPYEAEGWTRLERQPVRSLLTDLDIWPDAAALDKRRDVVVLKRLVGVRRRAAARLNDSPGWKDSLGLQYCASLDRLTPAMIEQARAILPHIAKVVEIRRSFAILENHYRAILGALDKFEIGVCIADGNGEIIFSNNEAMRIFSLNDGIARHSETRRLHCADAVAAGQLRDALSRAAATVRGEDNQPEAFLQIPRRRRAHPFVVEVSPLNDAAGEFDRKLQGALVFLIDPETPRPFAVENVARCFNLSDAESEVCARMVQGLTDIEIAISRGVSVDTVKSQMKAIYRKTNTRRRTDLLRKTLAITPPIERPRNRPETKP